ncbi:CYP734A1 protein [Hibiscus syriacus]|uniref:CYP734A1 protein n=1 Tax=Hibiscus syriacus TaxID=106335 RepID=A0A6A2WBD6_HIBSY|nr:CYP734A1 protein [Hibiscus syriacus]
MWRRLLTSQLKPLATAPRRSAPRTAPFSSKSNVSSSPPSVYLLTRHFSAASDESVVKKVEDVMPIATGHEREELEGFGCEKSTTGLTVVIDIATD